MDVNKRTLGRYVVFAFKQAFSLSLGTFFLLFFLNFVYGHTVVLKEPNTTIAMVELASVAVLLVILVVETVATMRRYLRDAARDQRIPKRWREQRQ